MVSRSLTSLQMEKRRKPGAIGPFPCGPRAEMQVAGPELAGDRLTGHLLWSLASLGLICLSGSQQGGREDGGWVYRAEGTHQRIGKGTE